MFSAIGDFAELTLELTDIGSGWVHLSWDEGHEECGDEPFFPLASSTLHCNYTKDDGEPGEFSKEFSDQNTSARILDLGTNVTYTCWVEAESEASPSCRQHSPQVTFTPGIHVLYNILYIIIILRLLLCVCACVRAGSDRKSFDPRQRSLFFSASVDMDVTIDSPLTRLAMAPAATKVSCFKKTAGQN